MNPAKLLEDVLSLIRKYAPILIIHAVVLFWISARVLDVSALPPGSTIWQEMTVRINAALKALGLSLQLWYVFAALVIAYLTAFEWVRSILIQVPLLKVRRSWRIRPQLLGHAGEVLRIDPEDGNVNKQIQDLIEQYGQEYKEKRQTHPYQWQFDRENLYVTYYGTLLVVCGACIVWAASGAPMARSAEAVWRLALILALVAFAVRWRAERVIARGRVWLVYWAMREFERRNSNAPEDPLRYERGRWLESQASFYRVVDRHPAAILRSHLYLLPEFLRKRASDRLRYPPYRASDKSWDIVASSKMKFLDEKYVPPEALKVDGMVKQFGALLECAGSGLCILAPRELALAPSVEPGCGSFYSFATRTHASMSNGLGLRGGTDLARCEFTVESFDTEKAFLAEVGNIPIASLAQRSFPFFVNGQDWLTLISQTFDEGNWPADKELNGKIVSGVTIGRRMPVHPGSSYLMRAKSPGAEYVAVFQCFQVQDTAKILIAWRILNVFLSVQDAPEVLPWWNPRAWSGLLKQQP